MTERKPVFLVIGAGAGIGGHAAARFSAGGFHSVLARRSDEVGLEKLVRSIEDSGGSASGCLVDAAQDGAIEDLVSRVEKDIGPIEALLYNLGAQIGNRALHDTPHNTFQLGWRLGCFGVFRLAHAAFPSMEKRGKGTMIVTSATSAVRGNAGQHSHAAAMGGRRMLCQTLNAEFGSKGIHVAHVVVDGPVRSPDTLIKLLGDKWDAFAEAKGKDGIIDPAQIAETYWHLAKQPKNCWTHELDIRPYNDVPWWNDNPNPTINSQSGKKGFSGLSD